MDVADRLRLQKNWTYLLDSLNCEDVVPYLIQDLVFDIDTVEEIEAADTRKAKARRLLTKLMQRGPTAYDAFRKALRENEVYEHLLDRLDATNVDLSTISSQTDNNCDRADIGITPLDDDSTSNPSALRSEPIMTSHGQAASSEPAMQPPSSTPPSSSNFRIAGNHNFVIVGSSNTQVYYH
ncbi:uncharacterized protein [Diadema antillarum]|uniref:uncharacterized protein isoform X2 n=1 Tax=Diadema antillarum TaxID=105358 RepID=UPI003A8633F3